MGVRELPFDAAGHMVNKEPSDFVTVMFGETFTYTDEKTGEERTHEFEERCLDFMMRCAMCGEWVDVAFDSVAAWSTTECQFSGGIVSEILLKVPSGVMVIDDNIREIYDYREEDDEGYMSSPDWMADYNSRLGQAQAIEEMAKLGCAYGPVGNSCPSFYKMAEGKYAIASDGYEYVRNQEDPDDCTDIEIPVPGEALAFICTDLWAYCVADYDDYVAKGGTPRTVAHPNSYRSFVEVPAGTYKFTHHTGELGFDQWSSDITYFAHVERVSD